MNSFKNILCAKDTSQIVKDALTSSYLVKCVSDVNAAGGAIFELTLCEGLNKLLKKSGNICLTKKPALRGSAKRFSFPKNFWDTIDKDAFHKYSCADLFLFDKNGNFLDAVSLKTSIVRKGASKPYIHNDSMGQIYREIKSETHIPSIGQVFIVTYNKESKKADTFFFDGDLNKIVNLFSGNARQFHSSGKMSFKGHSYGIKRQVLTSVPRGKQRKGTSAQSSFNRGVIIDGQFLKDVCATKKLVKNPHSFTLQDDEIMIESLRKITAGRLLF